MATLIVAEKPRTAARIAWALGEGKVKPFRVHGVTCYQLERGGEKIFVAPAAGHLFVLTERHPSRGYPVFDVVWRPYFEVCEKAAHTRGYIEAIKALAKSADKFVAATDFDLEGEVIAGNIFEFACGTITNVKRMRFSTLTREELVAAYEGALPSLQKKALEAGRARHLLDWMWGINTSRALMCALSKAGVHKVMSVGRVQGPMLALIAQREEEIESFVAQRYWLVLALCEGCAFRHQRGRFFDKGEAEKILLSASVKGKVLKFEVVDEPLPPPPPYDLTSLQVDAFKLFRFTPARTLATAQALYERGLISYPRTSSQKLPLRLNLRRIIEGLARSEYAQLANALIKGGRFKPREGKKVDPAHPAIHPTGIVEKIGGVARALYDLITRRFLACFAEPARRRRWRAELQLGGERFVAEGILTIKRGWLDFLPYIKLNEAAPPKIREGQEVTAELKLWEGVTQPPPRYTPATIIRELERRCLGTEATRADILRTLYRRGYVGGYAIRLTPLGKALIAALRKNCPEILSEELTRKFERELQAIQSGERDFRSVADDGRSALFSLLNEFKEVEGEIGLELANALSHRQ